MNFNLVPVGKYIDPINLSERCQPSEIQAMSRTGQVTPGNGGSDRDFTIDPVNNNQL